MILSWFDLFNLTVRSIGDPQMFSTALCFGTVSQVPSSSFHEYFSLSISVCAGPLQVFLGLPCFILPPQFWEFTEVDFVPLHYRCRRGLKTTLNIWSRAWRYGTMYAKSARRSRDGQPTLWWNSVRAWTTSTTASGWRPNSLHYRYDALRHTRHRYTVRCSFYYPLKRENGGAKVVC